MKGTTMERTLRNTAAVLIVTVFTALTIFATVQLTARVTGISSLATAGATPTYSSSVNGAYASNVSQSGSGQTMTCPATGCTATSCHAMQ
jgi:hypothetical protein